MRYIEVDIRHLAHPYSLVKSSSWPRAQDPRPALSPALTLSFLVIYVTPLLATNLLSSILHFKQRDTEIDSGVFLQSGCIFFSTLPSEYAAGKGYIFSLLLCTASLALHCPFGCAVLCPLGHCTVHCTAALTCFGPISPNMFRPYQP